MELPNLDAAEREAAEVVAQMGRDKLPISKSREIVMEVRDEHGRPVLTATVSLNIVRVEPPPSAPKRG